MTDQQAQLTAEMLLTESSPVLRLRDVDLAPVRALMAVYGLTFELVAHGAAIPGSYWGECEAGIIAETVYARSDTPVHSLLHEACHLIVLPKERRSAVHTDATDSVAEEDASCYLQILLADRLPGVGQQRLLRDMDSWGYSFRLGSAEAWFRSDADDARAWLFQRGLVDAAGQPCQPVTSPLAVPQPDV